MTNTYYDKVFRVTKLIPLGRVTNYGAIADFLALGSARMVGWALNKCAHLEIPAHRVVNSKGELSGRNQFPHPELMAQLLQNEGIEIRDHKVINFKDVFWHPGWDLNQEDFL
jgi:methylated-DNA-protein-cysteine methyltransferase-like protein